MSITEELAGHISATTVRRHAALRSVEAAKVVILDGLAVTLAGSREQGGADRGRLRNARWAGIRSAQSFGHGFKTSPPMAAFVNGVAGHVLDYEVMWHPATHATSPDAARDPGAWPRAVRATGRDILAALITGFEVQGRIRVASAEPEPERIPSSGAGGCDGQRRRGFGDARPRHARRPAWPSESRRRGQARFRPTQAP